MAFSEIETARYAKEFAAFRERFGPKPEIRSQLDWGCRMVGQSIELYEIRPRWDEPSEILHLDFAKATYVKSTSAWKVYWMRASGKWDSYQPCPQAGSLERFFQVVADDEAQCFFG